jgi:2-polyprenyl-3-methyl-5-hydroxy-6-metoxy-1,4-benzoquinol methylase
MKKSNEVEATKKYYNQKFQNWTDRKTNSFHHEKPFTKLVTLWPQKGRIIDIGCAHGICVPMFLGIGQKLEYYGIDISTAFIKVAMRRYPQLPFALGNIADKQTLPKKKFDGFWAAAVLMHVPFSKWDEMFTNVESLCKPASYGYISLPIAHPSKTPSEGDIRHFTILTEDEQRTYIKSRGWKIKHSGVLDGFTTESVWRWYIVQLP